MDDDKPQKDRRAASVFDALRDTAASLPRINLREAAEPFDTPVVRLPAAGGGPAGLPERMGHYQLMGEIARGGIGIVLKAHDVDLGRDVALKVLQEERRQYADVVCRFVEEAQIGSQMQHPGVVPVHELGVLEGGVPYFTMKLVKGRTLAALLEDRADPSQDRLRLLGVFDQACQALAYAHARNVIHRDLKPSNIMVGAFGEVQVMDWGLAKVLAQDGRVYEDRSRATRMSAIQTIRTGTPGSDSLAGSILGTPAYMSPEQARGELESIDRRSDVFGLGAILCEILTGKPPYAGATFEEVTNQARKGYLDDAFSRLEAAAVDPDLAALVKRCLAFEPRERPADASEVALALRGYLDALEARARSSAEAAAAARVQEGEDRRARRLVALLGAAALLLVLVGGVSYWGVAGQRRARGEEATRLAQEAFGTATASLGKARASGGADLALWDTARAAARVAVERAASDAVPGERREAAARLVAAAETEGGAARAQAEREEKDRRTARRLEDLLARSAAHGGDPLALGLEYRTAFNDRGLDPEGEPLEATAEALRPSAIRAELTRALGSWALILRESLGERSRGWRKLLAVALAVEPDPASSSLLRALEDGDRMTLRRVAAALDLRALAPSALAVLVQALHDGSGPVAGALSRRIEDLEPGSFLAHVGLHWSLPSGRDEVSHALAAFALEPGPATSTDLGRALFFERDPLETRLLHEEALRRWPLDPASDVAMGYLAASYLGLDLWGLATRYFEEAIARKPGDWAAHNNFGVMLANGLDRDLALRRFEEASRIEASSTSSGNAAIQLLRLGRKEAAVAAFREALRLRGEGAQRQAFYHGQIGRILLDQGHLEGAAYHFREAARLHPLDAEYPAREVECLVLQGKLPEALGVLAARLNALPSRSVEVAAQGNGVLTSLLAALKRAGPPDSALRAALGSLLAETRRVLASSASSRPVLGRLLFAVLSKSLEGAAPEVVLGAARAEVAKSEGRDPEALAFLAETQLAEGDGRGAVATLEAASELEEGSSSRMRALLTSAREALAPDLPTFASIDQALEGATRLVAEGDLWRYFPGRRDPSPGLEWTALDFDDGAWPEGPSGFGYGDGDDRTVLGDMENNYTTVYLRRRVLLPSPDAYRRLTLRVCSDDGFIAYLNGEELCRFRAGIPGERLGSSAVAYADHESGGWDAPDVCEVPLRLLRPGENLLALQGLNRIASSSDFTLIPELLGERALDAETPGDPFAAFRQAAAASPGGPARLDYLEGRLLAQAGKLEEAAVRLRRAHEGSPGEPLPLSRLWQCLRDLGKKDEARATLEAGVSRLARIDRTFARAWVAAEEEAGRGWHDVLAAWPRVAPPYRHELVATAEVAPGASPGSTSSPPLWRYTTRRPPLGWQKPGFDDGPWLEGPGVFGFRDDDGSPRPSTEWNTSDIWLRHSFAGTAASEVRPYLEARLELRIIHDDDAEVYLNGVEVARLPDWSHDAYLTIPLDLACSLRTGENVLAIHCRNVSSTQLIDAGLHETILTRAEPAGESAPPKRP